MFQVPEQFTFQRLLAAARIGRLDPKTFTQPCGLDFTKCGYAGGGTMASVKALLTKHQNQWPAGTTIPVIHNNGDSVRYLQRMNFFTSDVPWALSTPLAEFKSHDSTGKFVPIFTATHESQTSRLAREITSCVQLQDGRAQSVLVYAISEIIDNSLQHARALNGTFVSAQYFKANSTVGIAVADAGIGIRSHLSEHPAYAGIKTDEDAVIKALKPNVTGTFQRMEDRFDEQASQNQGMGLSVVNEIAKRSGGVLCVWSGTALYRSSEGIEKLPVEWPGTVVSVVLPTDVSVDFQAVFTELHAPLQKPKRQLRFG